MESESNASDNPLLFLRVLPREAIVPPGSHIYGLSPGVPDDQFELAIRRVKQAALMFDHVGLVGLRGIADYLAPEQVNEVEFLLEKTVLDDCDIHLPELYRSRARDRYITELTDRPNPLLAEDGYDALIRESQENEVKVGATNCRRAAAYLRRVNGWEVVPLLSPRAMNLQAQQHRSETAQLVLNTLPLPQ